MKVTEWNTYRTRFLVKAKQLNGSLSFTDHLGRQHCGRKGDYLVESCEGVLSIAPRQIFEDIYVPIAAHHELPASGAEENGLAVDASNHLNPARVGALEIGRIKHGVFQYEPGDLSRRPHETVVRDRRKSPLPVHPPAPRVRLM